MRVPQEYPIEQESFERDNRLQHGLVGLQPC